MANNHMFSNSNTWEYSSKEQLKSWQSEGLSMFVIHFTILAHRSTEKRQGHRANF